MNIYYYICITHINLVVPFFLAPCISNTLELQWSTERAEIADREFVGAFGATYSRQMQKRAFVHPT